MKYDDASWHSGGNFPAGQPEEYGGTHIALFLKWCFVRGWAGELHITDEAEDTRRVIDGSLSATEFLFKYCDGKLTNEDLNDHGNVFAAQYYGDEGLYLEDYAGIFEDLMYVAPESAHDFGKLSVVMDDRYRSGVLTKAQAAPRQEKKPWWKPW